MSTPTIPETTTSDWDKLFARVGNEDWLAARALLDVDPYRVVQRDAAQWVRHYDGYGEPCSHRTSEDCYCRLNMDWDAWVADVVEEGRGWSSTQWRLFWVVAGITTGRPFNIVGVLDLLNEWSVDVWRILTEWGTGGDNDNRRLPGRASVISRGLS